MRNCHEGREFIELFRKKNFWCDCGNSKFEHGCLLNNDKDLENELNKYSHNFKDSLCNCGSKYTGESDMIICYFCEDWFHPSCLTPKLDLAKVDE